MDLIEPLYSYIPRLGKTWIVAAVIFGLLLVVILLIIKKKCKLQGTQVVAMELLGVYLFLVFASTVFSRRVTPVFTYKLLPFWSYLEILKGRSYYIQENFLNVLMLMPLGILLPIAVRRLDLKCTAFAGCGCSLCIELLQLLWRRGLFEFDDIVHNTLGVIVGYGIYVISRRCLDRRGRAENR